jgi:hypothetical protein
MAPFFNYYKKAGLINLNFFKKHPITKIAVLIYTIRAMNGLLMFSQTN